MRVAIVGAGMGGLAAAADLAREGCDVSVFEAAAGPGGKMREVLVDGEAVAGGPTVFTMRWIFEGLFADAGDSLEARLGLERADVLARHAWRPGGHQGGHQGGRLDLFADVARSADAIGDFAGAAAAQGYRDFCARAADIHRTLAGSFIAAQRPSPVGLVRRVGWRRLAALLRLTPWHTLWQALGTHFEDPRLRQLFGRYATYCGASPMLAPATLMLVAHVEQEGVWLVRGGIRRVAEAMQGLAERQGARCRYGAAVREILVERGRAAGVLLASGERVAADAVVFNGDASALGAGLLGGAARAGAREVPRAARSLSAVTWCLHARASGFPLLHHNVFFAEDYREEFDAIFGRREICAAPTAYICAQDRGDGMVVPEGRERLLLLVNAPPDGDLGPPDDPTLEARTHALLRACGLELEGPAVRTDPSGFHALFPGTGGALYGRASHGAAATFARPGAASRVPGLYLAGGSVHPGPGIPMAAMSGRLAAARLLDEVRVRGALPRQRDPQRRITLSPLSRG